MDGSALMVFGGGLVMSGYVYVAVLLRLNDSVRDLPSWVPLAWPVLLPLAFGWMLVARWLGRTA